MRVQALGQATETTFNLTLEWKFLQTTAIFKHAHSSEITKAKG